MPLVWRTMRLSSVSTRFHRLSLLLKKGGHGVAVTRQPSFAALARLPAVQINVVDRELNALTLGRLGLVEENRFLLQLLGDALK